MAPLEQIKITAADLQAAGQEVQDRHLDPKTSVEITRSGNGGTILTWHTNGTTGATIYDGKVIPSK
jgi:hypothetical protein